MRKLLLTILTILAVVALSGATAASASAVPTITANASGALYTGTTGNDVNTLSMVSSPNRYKLTGTATPGTGCSTSGSDIFCPLTGSLGEMHGGAGDDELQAQLPAIDAAVYGDDGSDRLYASGKRPTPTPALATTSAPRRPTAAVTTTARRATTSCC
jgi:hypothetical protein